MLGNRGGLAPKIANECLLLKGPKCCVSRTLEGSPCYRSGSCAICTGPYSLSIYIIILDPDDDDDDRAYVCNITPWLTPHFN